MKLYILGHFSTAEGGDQEVVEEKSKKDVPKEQATQPNDILHVVEATRTSVDLEWDQYQPPSEPPPTIYRIYKRNSGRTTWIKVTETREKRVKVSGLQKDTAYDFSVTSVRDKKESSLFEVSDVHTKDSGKPLL